MRVAFIYDWVNTFGGAERILLELHHLYPDAPLYTTVYNQKSAFWAHKFKIRTSFLQEMPFAKTHHELYPVITPIAFESFNFVDFDLVISITSGFAKGIITKPGTLHICYLLTPVRYLWSHREFYFSNRLLRLFSRSMVSYLKRWDLVAKTRPDYYLTISRIVQKRVKDFYNLESEIVYPPVLVDKFKQIKRYNKNSGYFLVVSRLVPYKRIDLAISACNKLQKKLTIIGMGRAEKQLKKIAGPTIFFLNNLTDEALISYYQNCRVLILPSEEDFGIVSVEAQAAGKPVIAYGQGGALETVLENKTGIFFQQQNVESLIQAINKFETMIFLSQNCQDNANKYTNTRFKKEFNSKINNYYHKYYRKFLNNI